MAIATHFGNVRSALEQLDQSALGRLAQRVRRAREAGRTVWLCGNGGSFANAQHWACDLVKVSHVRAMALGDNTPLLMAWANDNGHHHSFAVELGIWATAGDLLICLSCSGTSGNIIETVAVAKEQGVTSFLLTSIRQEQVAPADHIVRVWSRDYGVIEDCHSAIGHWLAKELQ
jgi:D-sedoheptulose 7-phosphate isomerase